MGSSRYVVLEPDKSHLLASTLVEWFQGTETHGLVGRVRRVFLRRNPTLQRGHVGLRRQKDVG
jgi:hypothetical protein